VAINGGTWTYTGNPATDVKDAVRWLVGDTDGSTQLTSDEEILFAIAMRGNRFAAAALVADQIAGVLGRLADKKVVGDFELDYLARAGRYRDLATRLREQAAIGATPYGGGISGADKAAVRGNSDQVSPAFQKGVDDNPWNTQQERANNLTPSSTGRF
jgi:hypothetical protein